MIRTIYIIILIYFALGGAGFYLINRRKTREAARESYVKFGMYFLIINLLFFSIVVHPMAFRILSVLIIIAGFIELSTLFVRSGRNNVLFFSGSVIIYSALSILFFIFGSESPRVILFAFLVLSIFDSFSQITGQLWGHHKLIPKISPGKTWEGLLGGVLVSLFSAWLLRNLVRDNMPELLIFTLGIAGFAFLGDLLSSIYKRKYRVKDFNRLIPGHGGFLDRFDSLIAGGAWVGFYSLIIQHL
jgi:phosphatidate cytidylyltransferase